MRKLPFVLAAAAAILTVASAQAAGPSLTLSASTIKVLYGNPVTLSGRLTSGVAGKRVSVWARRGVASPAKVATVTTGAGGRWTYTARPGIATSYMAHAGAAVSRSLTVGVQPLVRGTVLGNGAIRASVRAGRSFAGRSVQLQQQNGHTWTTIAKKQLDTHSAALFPPLQSTARLRIAMSVNQAGTGFLGATSHVLGYQPHGLTLTPSSFRVLYGSRLTLAGHVANGSSGTRVTVLAWRYGRSAGARVVSAVTNAHGDWSVHVRPVIQTAYQAVSAGTQSPRLTVGVVPLITLRELVNGYVSAHVAAGKRLEGRQVKLQRRVAGGAWSTVKQKPLNRSSTAVFGAALPTSQLRVTLSVNQAGAGLLGSISHVLVYHAA